MERYVLKRSVALRGSISCGTWGQEGRTLLRDVTRIQPIPIRDVLHLHVWLWQDNPAGMFTPFNPTVNC